MLLNNIKFIAFLLCSMLLITAFKSSTSPRDLSSFSSQHAQCYNRDIEPYTAVVDSHMHFNPFGGPSLPFSEIIDYFNKTGVLFANVNGIGQILPSDADCRSFIECPGTPVRPSVQNDFINVTNYLKHKPDNVHLTLAMTFPDLANPEPIVETMALYEREYPNMFKWMGEVNLLKQALLPNFHKPATIEHIDQWKAFMAVLKERNIPLNIHSDLGTHQNPTQFLYLMEHVLTSYPDNKIVWAHMGVSPENIPSPKQHIKVMSDMLNKHPNLMLDISWSLLNQNFFVKKETRALYVRFFNQYSTRILPGTDFVGYGHKNFKDYKIELEATSNINQYLNNKAFRNIALGENYFRLLNLPYHAPEICDTKSGP